ncbi:MAG TPA: hypothetical protein VFV34_11725, partial [Blastocatellia bacterium]|nr:hypothetical protein [Blastocatellia bacterium]
RKLLRLLVVVACCPVFSWPAGAQEKKKEPSGKEVYTGTIVTMSGKMHTVGFNLTVTGKTSDEEAANYLAILASEGQEALLKASRKNKLGYISATGQTGRDLLFVRDGELNGKRRLVAVFERWVGFFEARGGYRSLDYPWAIMEIIFDEKGKGTGTFIAGAWIKIEKDKKTEKLRLEIENFGTFPSKVMGVIRRNK